ncbi:hypothetical protein EVAR_10850_1 [Eumeta japonica]|uniref:HAT C-terminal dimerisation domain-containing protein n=1 Tax=Eumeta variegata TaxID=151549 RepID=A0A4C1UT82_EUMVA|nr:hypothetical protein EVAR_10850_1 [Eumeta japonica]
MIHLERKWGSAGGVRGGFLRVVRGVKSVVGRRSYPLLQVRAPASVKLVQHHHTTKEDPLNKSSSGEAHEDEELHIQEDLADIPGTSSGFQNVSEKIMSDVQSSFPFREKKYDDLSEWPFIDSATIDEIITGGPRESWVENTPNNGNFLGLVQLLGKIDIVMMEHLRRVVNKETNVHYFGKRIQNELIGLLGSEVRNNILSMVKLAKYFSSILDCTPDVSHVEQLSVTFRFVDTNEEVEVRECFVVYKPYRASSSALITAKEIASQAEIDPVLKAARSRRKKQLFDYEAVDKTPSDSEKLFKMNVFYPMIDTIENALVTRFKQLSVFNDTWSLLYNMKIIPERSILEKACANLQISLTDGKKYDVSGCELVAELMSLNPLLKDLQSAEPLTVLQLIKKNDWLDIFPNVWTALHILLTIPVTVAKGERSFSKLKLTKTYLRSTVSGKTIRSWNLVH